MNVFSTLPGFSNPVDDTQAVFRAVLHAFSRPGIFVSLPVLPPPIPVTGFSQGMLALALTLCDSDTLLWLDNVADTPEVRHHLRFHCGSPFVTHLSEASFAFIAEPGDMPRLRAFNQGRSDFPDRSATLVINANLSEGSRRTHELTGPGVKNGNQGFWQGFHVSGLPVRFWEEWEENNASYPLGVDILFVDTQTDDADEPLARLLGLPRTACVRTIAPPSAVKERSVCM